LNKRFTEVGLYCRNNIRHRWKKNYYSQDICFTAVYKTNTSL